MIRIATMSPADRQAVRAIYEEGIATGHATFETRSSDWDEWDRDHLPAGRLVAHDGGEIIGRAALTRASGRRVYRGVAEAAIYVAAAHRGGST